jgi:hypothetical protein
MVDARDASELVVYVSADLLPFIPDRRNLKSCRRPAGLHPQPIYSEISLKVMAAESMSDKTAEEL